MRDKKSRTTNFRKKRYIQKTGKTKCDMQGISSIIANFCQVGLLALALFGYFYTVRPVYQNKMLTEENAKLVAENARIKMETALLMKKIEPLTRQIQTLQEKNDALENQYTVAYQKLLNLQQGKKLREREEK